MISKNNYKLSNFIITTFTYNSAKQLKQKISNALNIDCKNSYIGTFHSLSHKIISKFNRKLLDGIHVDESIYILYDILHNNDLDLFKNINFLLIDEFQDLNEIQFNIIKLIIDKYPYISLICVGDSAQNIYTFRGSSIEYIDNFNKYFPNGQIIEMNKNYRNNKNIMEIANIIGYKNMIYNANYTEVNPIRLISFDNIYNEIEYVCNEIRRDIQNNIQLNEICIMSRNNQLLFYYEAKLFELGIKNIIVSDEKIRNNIPDNTVILSTIHGSKGLEYEKLYLVGMTDTFFPHNKDKKSIEEERRLCYVAITRCKNNLMITYTKNNINKLSRYIDEIPNKYFLIKEFAKNSKNKFDKIDFIESKAVTQLIKYLNGDDYQYLRKEKIITNNTEQINIKEQHLYEPYFYPDFVIRENYFSEFGIFIDYLIRRMIGQHTNLLYDGKANEVLISLYLEPNYWNIYDTYKIYIQSIINEINNMNQSKQEIILYITNRTKKYVLEHVKIKKNITENILIEILEKIYKRSLLFKIPIISIKITNKNYMPNIFENIMKKSYLKFIDYNKNWNEIIYDIWLISKIHFISLDRLRPLYIDIQLQEILDCFTFYENIYDYLLQKYLNNSYNFVLNPCLSNKYINGEGDILIEDKQTGKYTIIDIKVSSIQEFNIEHLIQLMVYTYLLREQGKEINEAIIFNPLLGKEYIIDLSNWNKGKELINYLLQK
jgi:hypothetical protein